MSKSAWHDSKRSWSSFDAAPANKRRRPVGHHDALPRGAPDVARGLNLNRNSVSTRLASMAKAGKIAKAAKGYSAK